MKRLSLLIVILLLSYKSFSQTTNLSVTRKTAADIKKDYIYCENLKDENQKCEETRQELEQTIVNQESKLNQKDTIISRYREEVYNSEQQTQLFKDQSEKRSKKLTYSILGNIGLAILLFFAVK